ncbi:MAG TPA: hypothetical protein VMM92_03410 [Thermoanaerobaculia bacterium]|nr:hypothetical protein [Thermoanaerobaculia bacterium]
MGMVYAVPPVNPPQQALAGNAGSAIASGVVVATGMPGLLVLAWNMISPGATRWSPDFQGAPLHHVGLAAALMFAAVVLAALALYFTIFSRPKCEETEVKSALSQWQFAKLGALSAYALLTLLGLAADALAPTFLVVGNVDGFRLAAIVGTLLQILAFFVGLRGYFSRTTHR